MSGSVFQSLLELFSEASVQAAGVVVVLLAIGVLAGAEGLRFGEARPDGRRFLEATAMPLVVAAGLVMVYRLASLL